MYFYPGNLENFRAKALRWASEFGTYMYLNGNGYDTLHGAFPEKLAVGVRRELKTGRNVFEKLEEFIAGPHGWIFGYISYDAKNEVEDLTSKNPDFLQFPIIHFFEPQFLLTFYEGSVFIESDNASAIYQSIERTEPIAVSGKVALSFYPETGKSEYLKTGHLLKQHILEGDIYEINYCIRYFARKASIDPLVVYLALNSLSGAPFSLVYETGNHAIISASPERFLKKEDRKIISQPMKGTIRRGNTKEEDELLKEMLRHCEKEIAENMMIMDLVRNDLARTCIPGTVNVEELFGIYSFPKVHQMITTVTGMLRGNSSVVDVIRNAFPMGSMTGAPKIRAMELIDTYERFFRGAFSGAAGYISPDNDFDFNVLIRSLFYNKQETYLSFSAGSAITYDCDLEKEWNECQLKAAVFRQLFA